VSEILQKMNEVSPHFSNRLAADPRWVLQLQRGAARDLMDGSYRALMTAAMEDAGDLGSSMTALRQTWSPLLLNIVVDDLFQEISIRDAKRRQTELAAASIDLALEVALREAAKKFGSPAVRPTISVLALGKLGGRGLDYDSDLDLILVNAPATQAEVSPEFYSRVVEIFVEVLSAMTRDGSLYRVDLRLRPYGSKGLSIMPSDAFLEYINEKAAIWEMLAFVKMRAVGGDLELGRSVEEQTRELILDRASLVRQTQLASETSQMRHALEKHRRRNNGSHGIDIKYGEGGMLDVYFVMRYLQLASRFPDDPDDRSTSFMLTRLRDNGLLTQEQYSGLYSGYSFLGSLDHNIRLTVGRTTRVPVGNKHAMGVIADRLGLGQPTELLQQLSLHRLSIRSIFQEIMSTGEPEGGG
jgi:[glutamine synthetase] adenylyltransferase / [glutamine synthetase]-adenylyl-L-tyrosine phosphorylase